MSNSNTVPIGFRVEDGIVVELIAPHPDGFSLDECFPAELGVLPIPAGASPALGMTWDGKVFGPIPPAPPQVPASRSATVSALLDALSTAQRGTITPDHMSRLVARAAVGHVVVTDPKVKRAADDLSIAPDAWFTLAGA